MISFRFEVFQEDLLTLAHSLTYSIILLPSSSFQTRVCPITVDRFKAFGSCPALGLIRI